LIAAFFLLLYLTKSTILSIPVISFMVNFIITTIIFFGGVIGFHYLRSNSIGNSLISHDLNAPSSLFKFTALCFIVSTVFWAMDNVIVNFIVFISSIIVRPFQFDTKYISSLNNIALRYVSALNELNKEKITKEGFYTVIEHLNFELTLLKNFYSPFDFGSLIRPILFLYVIQYIVIYTSFGSLFVNAETDNPEKIDKIDGYNTKKSLNSTTHDSNNSTVYNQTNTTLADPLKNETLDYFALSEEEIRALSTLHANESLSFQASLALTAACLMTIFLF